MAQQVMEISYDDYTVDTDLLKKRTDAALHLFKSTCAETTQPYEVPNTSDQSNSEEWKTQRFMRITASNAKEVASVRTDRGRYHLMKRILWGYKLPKLKALTYGKNNEVNALNAYQAMSRTTVTKSGLWINPNHPELACSPDGLIYENGSLTKVVEIKCPLVLEALHPADIIKLKPKQRYTLCYEVNNGAMKLKEKHAYYFQIQMQMAVTDVAFCDFVVWSPKGILVQTVGRDDQFWNQLYPKLLGFHHTILMPEYLEMRIPRRLMPIVL